MDSDQDAFIDMHTDLADEIQVKLLDYVKTLSQPGPATVGTSNGTSQQIDTPPALPTGNKKARYKLESEDGFPKVPLLTEDDKLTKSVVEDILRQFLTEHYSK